MKKFITVFFAILLMSCSVFAKTYKVKKIIGKVYHDDKTPIIKEDVLDDSTPINMGVNCKIYIMCIKDGYEYSLGPAKKGTVKNLIDEKMSKKNKFLIGSTVTKSDVSNEDIKATKGISTASTRASEAKQDVEWDE